MNITITPKAEKFMRRIVRFGGGPADSGFRLTVTAGGFCSNPINRTWFITTAGGMATTPFTIAT